VRAAQQKPAILVEAPVACKPARPRRCRQRLALDARNSRSSTAIVSGLRCERKVVDAIRRTFGQPFGPGLEAIQEARVDEQPRDGLLDAGFEAALLPASLVETEQRLELGVAGIHGPPIRERREAQQDLARARRLAAIRGDAAEDGAPARRVAGAGRLERPVDLYAVYAAAGGVDAI